MSGVAYGRNAGPGGRRDWRSAQPRALPAPCSGYSAAAWYTVSPQSTDVHVVCPPPCPPQAAWPTSTSPAPSLWPLGHCVGGWVIHLPAEVCTSSPSTRLRLRRGAGTWNGGWPFTSPHPIENRCRLKPGALSVARKLPRLCPRRTRRPWDSPSTVLHATNRHRHGSANTGLANLVVSPRPSQST